MDRSHLVVASASVVLTLALLSCVMVVSGSGPAGLTQSAAIRRHASATQSIVGDTHTDQRERAKTHRQTPISDDDGFVVTDDEYEPKLYTPIPPFQPKRQCPNPVYNFGPYDYCHAGFFTASTYPSPTPIAGSSWSLKGVQLLTRHGDRTPVNILPYYDVAYPFCDVTESLGLFGANGARKDDGSNGRHMERLPLMMNVSNANPFGGNFWQGNCMNGQLTRVGVEQLTEIGQSLRDIYVTALEFLPPTYSRGNTSFYLRTTDVWRTRQSAESLLNGLWPTDDDTPSEVIPLHTYPAEIETMYANTKACPALAAVQAAQTNSAEWQAHLNVPEVWDTLDSVLGVGSLRSWHEGFDHQYDNLKTRECHNLPLPCQQGNTSNCIPPNLAEYVYEQGDWEYQYMMLNSPLSRSLAQLGIGGFMSTIRDVIVGQITNQPSKSAIGIPNLAYYSGHDTTLGAVLGALNVTGFRWPPYASNMQFELWLSSPQGSQSTVDPPVTLDDGAEFYVRVLYNGAVLPMFAAGCCDDMCPVEQFLDYLNTIIPDDITQACQA